MTCLKSCSESKLLVQLNRFYYKLMAWKTLLTLLGNSGLSSVSVLKDNTSTKIFSRDDATFIDTFKNDSSHNLAISTESPEHHKVKRSILLYKQKTLKIQVPDAPLFISSGQEGVGGENGMPISVMLKSPEHSLKTLPHLIKALKESPHHDEKPPESNGNHQHSPPEHQNTGGPAKHMSSQHTLNGESHSEVASEYAGRPEAKMKLGDHHLPKHPVPVEGRFPSHLDDPPHAHNEPVPVASHHYLMYPPHYGQEVNSPPEPVVDHHQNRVGLERISQGAEETMNPGNHWHGGGAKEFDSIKKETSNRMLKKIAEEKMANSLKQDMKRDEHNNLIPESLEEPKLGNKNLIPESLEEPKLESIQDLANSAMNFQSIKFVKNSWILPPVTKKNHPTNFQTGDSRTNAYSNDLSKSFSFPGYETKKSDSRNYNKPKSDLNVNHALGDKYILTGTEEPEVSFDDKGNLLFLKKQTLEILVPKYLMNYTQERATTAHYEPQYPENYQNNPNGGNPTNKISRVNMKYITQNERDKEFFMQRHMKKRRVNRDIKATFWHNRGLEDQLIAKTSSPTEKQR